ncbi:gluconate:H+ symporter [Dinghuibacter silviterrae]|uniref:Gnt-I system high-affinity gluconate transporter n=1 Tax=Dinghuibacter silviterrae TaxID=1539049 RepID=A0A4R8DFR1_9BACT|nr:gluconate:H+ symporter [Dinghuibacter silviterrae]TDW96277.1 Gnt-I system high-affinity gluconate transporter [Dinghuibacter silviterrae]
MPLILCVIGILCLILLMVWCKLDAFISFIVVSVGLGLAYGLDIKGIAGAIQKGIGSILGTLVIILGFGAMLGRLVADSGAAQQIMDSMIRVSGRKGLLWAMALAGLVIGIPLFYTAGFVVVMPLIAAVGASTGLPLVHVGMPMLSALSVAHGFLPPHPSPTAITHMLHADLGRTLLYGLMAAVPAIVIAGPLFAQTLKKYTARPDPALLRSRVLPKEELPGLGVSLLTALLPLVLLTATTVLEAVAPKQEGTIKDIITFIGDPNIAMLISVLVAVYVLGLRRGKRMTEVMKSLEDAFKGVAPVLMVIAGSGVFAEVMKEGGADDYIAGVLSHAPLSPLVLGWGIAAMIRVSVGSATVAGLTAAAIILPLMGQHPELHPELMVLSIGAGSLFCSHVNDGGFWLFKQYFNLSVRETFLTWSVMETIVSLVGLGMVLILNQIIG